MLKISIPTPCHEDWNKMSPNNLGRHCNSCVKTVVDFTNMSDEEVKNFFINKKQEHVCGRFSSKQLHRIQIDLPSNIFQLQMPLWKKFLVASLIVFSTSLFSCEVKQIADPKPAIEKPVEIPQTTVGMLVVPDTSKYFIPADTTIPVPMEKNVIQGEPALMGDIAILPEDTLIEQQAPACHYPNMQETVVGKPAYRSIDTIPKKQPDNIIKGEVNYIPDSMRINRDSTKCKDFS